MAAFSKPRGVVGMLFTVLALLQVTVALQHGSLHKHPAYRSAEAMEAHMKDTRSLLVERANNVAISGASDGSQYPRLEVRELAKNADQWNLFLLAMERFQGKAKTDRLSYYQIAGIHGRPFVSWNNNEVIHSAGYCPHAQSLFGSWHRPYLAVYEQAVYTCASEVVQSFPSGQQQRWKDALTGLRIPYFDWAMEPLSGEGNVPSSMKVATVSVTKSTGQVTIPNPLASYTWGDSLPSEMGWGPANGFPTTLRRPTGNPPVSNNDEVDELFGQSRVNWRQRVFALLSSKKDFGRASTAAFGVQTTRGNADSYESIHDEIHGLVGGNDGHMSVLDVAAFDPFFWLHHTNIDRLLALHQTLTSTWIADGVINRDMAQWNAGDVKNANTPLIPFTKDTSGSTYTSNDVKQTRALGYYYPETAGNDASGVIDAINKLYGAGETPIDNPGASSSSSAVASSATSAASSAAAAVSSAVSSAGSADATSSADSAATSSADSAASTSEAGSASGVTSGSSPSATPGSPSGSPNGNGQGHGNGNGHGSGHNNGGSGNGMVYPGRPFKDGDYDTVLSVVGDKYALPGSYSVHAYLGNKPVSSNSTVNGTSPFDHPTSNATAPVVVPSGTASAPVTLPSGNATAPSTGSPSSSGNSTTGTDYRNAEGYCGSHTFLGGSVANQNSSAPVLIEGSIPITAALQYFQSKGDLASLHPDHVEPYLKENLSYKIVGPNGAEFTPEQLPNFHVKVKSCAVSPAPKGELPTFHEYIELPRAQLPASAPWSYTPTYPGPGAVQQEGPLPSTGGNGSGSGGNGGYNSSPQPSGDSQPSGSNPASPEATQAYPPGSQPTGALPWEEPGYCVSHQVIQYVDTDGNLLYTETSS